MVGRCAVPGCQSTYYKGKQKENEITLFAIPKTSLSKWQELIPCSNLTSTSRICSRHFDESDFKTGIEILNVFHPYKRWTLNAGAIPKHFLLNVGANASNASVRKQPKVDKIPTTSKKKKCIKTASSMEATSTIQESINIHQAAEGAIFDPLHPDSIKENVAVVIEDSTIASPSMEATFTNFKSNFVTFQSLETSSKVPKNWMWSFDKIKLMIYCISMDQLPNGNFNVKIVRFQNKQEVMYYVNGKIIPSSTSALSNHFTTIEDISQLLKDFNNRKICSGIPQERFRNVNFPSRLSGTLDSTAGVLRSKFCRTISEKKRVCVQCLYLKKYLSQRLSKMEVKIPISKEKKEKSKLAEKKLAKRA